MLKVLDKLKYRFRNERSEDSKRGHGSSMIWPGPTVLKIWWNNLITSISEVNIQFVGVVLSRAKVFPWPAARDLRQYWCQNGRDIPPIMRKRVTTLPARRRSYPASEKNIILSAWMRSLNVQPLPSAIKQLISQTPSCRVSQHLDKTS
jgi:hypothetical protein